MKAVSYEKLLYNTFNVYDGKQNIYLFHMTMACTIVLMPLSKLLTHE